MIRICVADEGKMWVGGRRVVNVLHVSCGRTGAVLMFVVFFFNDTATTEIYTLSLHDALPICVRLRRW